MAEVRRGRYTADIEGDFVVLLIGPRLNSPRQVLASLRDLGEPRRGMRAMLQDLVAGGAEPLGHVAAHPTESDHPQLHRDPLLVPPGGVCVPGRSARAGPFLPAASTPDQADAAAVWSLSPAGGPA